MSNRDEVVLASTKLLGRSVSVLNTSRRLTCLLPV
jgi:hypothetical protein